MLILNDIKNEDHTATYDILDSYVTRCFIICTYNSAWPIDHDDGSRQYTDTYNFLVYGGYKNYLGHSKTGIYILFIS